MDFLSPSVHVQLNPNVIEILKGIDVVTICDFLNCDSKQIEKATTLPLKEVIEIRKYLLKHYSHPRNVYDYYKSILKEFAIIPTGISRLDTLLDGGLFTGNIYEICGLPAAGKTLLCLTLLKNITPKYTNQVYYIDTKSDFSALKLKRAMSQMNKEQITTTLNKITVARTNSQQDFLSILLAIKHSVQNGESTRLIIIDSIPALCFTSTDLTEQNCFLNYSANILQYLAKEYNVIIITTNLIRTWNDGDFINTGAMKEEICCGSYWYRVPNVRLSLTKDKDSCKITLDKTIKFIPDVNYCAVKFSDEGFV
ncbi:unnamed protein product [Phyllotreta striolata]|uniref:RecA family profile 1 domain-containing protein n=1 Tax=Phyllotreta striolata TaxID=444603 RepID=A0A9N9TYL3_PHYSR|nr:unnamed protein product [Phyllotreta striolata]